MKSLSARVRSAIYALRIPRGAAPSRIRSRLCTSFSLCILWSIVTRANLLSAVHVSVFLHARFIAS